MHVLRRRLRARLPALVSLTVMTSLWLLLLMSTVTEGAIGVTNRTSALEEARLQRENMVRKYLKRLKKEEGALKLVGGRGDYEGNVEIFHAGKWGAICDDEWDASEAEVVCRQLGFPGPVRPTHTGYFGRAKRKFWMDNLYCGGKEQELGDCHFDGWGTNDCEASEAAGVICKQHEEDQDRSITPKPVPVEALVPKERLGTRLEVRLVGGRADGEGRVEVRVIGKDGAGRWGSVCGDGWGLLEGNVVCRELGLGYANNAVQTDFFSGIELPAVLLSGTECYGNESSLADCLHDPVWMEPDAAGGARCSERRGHVAAVTCVPQMADLVFDHVEMEQSLHLEDRLMYLLQCAMEENCVASQAYEIQRENPNWHLETRRLLKFTARVVNTGTADFRPHIPKHLWEWHLCHMHYHSMEVFATFDVIDAGGRRVAEGHKASFCLEDNQCLPGIEPRYACANYGDQGISVNCSDIYRHNIDCQWVDISELDFGEYQFKVSINPEFKVPEMSFDNNAARCRLLYTPTYARVYDCELGRP
ncbi:lysyl oxidase homolog 2B-like [Anopheles albimanus]|uniref:protein-lysine 6-oxidase n=1 Tax=Anopheles albimanus TaxID=7167 RepID=A0A182F6N6_ANOAL|nr:lysyl oxidase homolog 2B-like [Anopheles albimanus]